MTDGDEKLIGKDNYIVCARLKDIAKVDGGMISFSVKLVQPNDSWCNYTWWTPIVEKPQDLFYLIMEAGHHKIEGAEFDVGSYLGSTHCRQNFYRYTWASDFATGSYPAVLAQHQTFFDFRFITFRLNDKNINFHAVSIFLQLHNFDVKWRPRTGDCIDFHWADHYDNNYWRQAYTTTTEKVSVLGYLPYHTGNCTQCEGIAFEAHEVDGITSDPRWVRFIWEYKSPPGVFGMFQSYYGGDTIIVRSFNHSKIGIGVIAREDQCSRQSIIHIQGEKMGFFVVGPNNFNWSPVGPDINDPIHPWKIDYSKGTDCCFTTKSDPCFTETPKTGCSGIPFQTISATTTPGLNVTNCLASCRNSAACFFVVYSKYSASADTCSLYSSCTQQSSTTSALYTKGCIPTSRPTSVPTSLPTSVPTSLPISVPISIPISVPISVPTSVPTSVPSVFPISVLTKGPVGVPTSVPTSTPTTVPIRPPTNLVSTPPTAPPSDCFPKDPNMMCSGKADKEIVQRDFTLQNCKDACASSKTCRTIGYSTNVCSLFDTCENPKYSSGTDIYRYNCRKPVCVNVLIADLFGVGCCDKNHDGTAWGGAKLFSYDSLGNYAPYSPTCASNPLVFPYCFDTNTAEEGAYAIFLVHGYIVDWQYKIFWQAYLAWNNVMYTGGHTSVMKFVFKRVTVDGTYLWAVLLSDESQNILPNQAECNSLIVDNGNGHANKKGCPVPPPPPPPPPPRVILPPPPKDVTQVGKKPPTPPLADTDSWRGKVDFDEINNGVKWPVSGASEAPAPARPAGAILPAAAPSMYAPVVPTSQKEKSGRRLDYDWLGAVQMEGYNSSWFETNGVGAKYAIALEIDQMDMLYVGTLCGGDPGDKCLDLAPQCYVYQVDGMFDSHAEDVEWEFCGKKGGYSSQLPFCIDAKGDCVPGEVVKWDKICVVVNQHGGDLFATLSGSVLLGGTYRSSLSSEDEAVIRSAVSEELSNAAIHGDAGDTFQLDVSFTEPGESAHRRLDKSSNEVHITFQAKVSVSRFGGYAKIGAHMKSYLSRSMSSGLFTAKVVREAYTRDAQNLKAVNFARLVELSVVHESEVNEEMSSIASTVLVVGLIVGSAFGYLAFNNILKKSKHVHTLLPVNEEADVEG